MKPSERQALAYRTALKDVRFMNWYDCPCGERWMSEWSCQCDDDCPECGTVCSPSESFDQGEE